MRALITAMIVMGVLIVLGTATLIAGIVHRISAGGMHDTVIVSEPAGTHIASISDAGKDRVALHVQGGGPDRVDIVDLQAGRVISRIVIAP